MSPKPIISWRTCPLVERPITSIALVLFLVFLSLILWNITVISWHYPIYYFGGMLLIIVSLLPYFIITDYDFYEDKIVIHYMFVKIERKYEDFGCFYKDKYGVMLSTFKMPRRLDSFRGQSIRFSSSRDEQDALIELLSRKIGKQY